MTEFLYDVFISHAYEDKTAFANDLAVALKQKGLKVWYSGFELRLGDSIADNVNTALLNAKYGVVIISPAYLEKQWAMSELRALLAQETSAGRILPLLHNLTVAAIKKQLPVIADRYSVSTKKSMQFIVNAVLQVVSKKRKYVKKNLPKTKAKAKKPKAAKDNINISDSGFITLGGNVKVTGGSAN
jgi:hypothetical protein